MARKKACILALTLLGSAAYAGVPYTMDDVFASVSNGMVNEYTPTGVLVQTLNTGLGGFTTGSAFDSSNNFLVTNFSSSVVSKFDGSANLLNASFATGDANSHNESISFAASGDFFVGQADGTHAILEFNSSGARINSFAANTSGQRGTDWVDLAADQKTIYYTGEGTDIRRFDTSTSTQLTNLISGLPGTNAFELRILGDGSVLVADGNQVVHVSSGGVVLHSYNTTNTFAGKTLGELFSLNLDPDGMTFWTGDDGTGEMYRVNIATGALVTSFATCGGGCLFGVSVNGEITQGKPPVPEPASIFLLGTVACLAGWRLRKKRA